MNLGVLFVTFGWVNWTVLIGVVLGTTVFGHVLKGKAKGLDGFFLGGKQLPWWAVSCSIMASQLSAVTVIAVPGIIFRTGGNLLFLQGTLIGFVVGKLLMVFVFVKSYYEKKIYSPYDFVEVRLGTSASNLSRGLFVASAILGHGIRLLTVALVLSVVVDIPVGQSILIMGLFAVLWTLMGGITTVVWTDFILFGLMFTGATLCLFYICGRLPFGIAEALHRLGEAGKLRLVDVSLNPAKTWTLWTSLICFTIFELAQNSVDQVITQRMMCCRDYREARKAVLGSLGIVGVTLLMTAVGLGVWLFYQHQALSPEHTAFLAEQPSRAYPFFVVRELPPGISGLVIGTIFAAGISTLDSALAALSETTVNGFYRTRIRPHASERDCLTVSRVSVVVWGVVLSALAYLAGQFTRGEALLNLAYKAPILTYGPLLMIALFSLARCKHGAALIAGAIASIITATTLLVLSMQAVIGLDEFWIYPITCLVFCTVVWLRTERKPQS
jgi:SSS family solute:Na+ symporter